MSSEKLIYQEVKSLTKTKMIELLKNNNIEKQDIIDIILCTSMNNVSFKLAEKVCERFIRSEDLDIKYLAVVAVGHIARVYGRLINKKILEEITNLYGGKDPVIYGAAKGSLGDIKVFLNIDFFKYKLVLKE